jgi:nucleoside-diphosphate-sugar epimerase
VWAHPNSELQRGDVRDTEAVRAAVEGMDAVVHLAAIVGDPACAREPALASAVNLTASLALLEASRRARVQRFVFASTCSNYGRMSDPDGYVDETSTLAPVSLYAETKVGVERALLDGADDGMVTTPLRFATVFGASPRMRFDLTVNEFTAELLCRGRLTVFGEQFWRPYVHVRDAARAVSAVLEAPAQTVQRQVFNVGSTEQNYQKQQLVELIRPLAPGAEVQYIHRAEDPRDYRVSFRRISEVLGYRVSRGVPEGIREVAAMLRDGIVGDWTASRFRN